MDLIATKQVRVWAGNTRKTINPTRQAQLVESIRAKGIQSALWLRSLPTPDGEITHEAIAGQCRLLAARELGLETVPFELKVCADDAEARELSLIENLQRTDPDPIEVADAIHELHTTNKKPLHRIASELGKSLSWVETRLALRTLVASAREDLASGKLPLGHAELLARLEPVSQEAVVERYKLVDYPSKTVFQREVINRMHNLAHAPFSVSDAKLQGGACDVCPKRSDKQTDLFGGGTQTTDAACLDAICWDRKCEAIWKRAKSDARTRKLAIVEDAKEVFDVYGKVHEKSGFVRYEGDHPELAPCAIARDFDGHVVELFDKRQVEIIRAEEAAAKKVPLVATVIAEPAIAAPAIPKPEKPAKAKQETAPVEVVTPFGAASERRRWLLAGINERLMRDGAESSFAVVRELLRAIVTDYPEETKVAFEWTGIRLEHADIRDYEKWHRALMLAVASVQLFHGLGEDGTEDPSTTVLIEVLELEKPSPSTGAVQTVAVPAVPAVAQRITVPAGVWKKYQRELLGTKGAPLVAAWKNEDGKRVAVIEPGLTLDHVLKTAREKEIEFVMEAAS